MPDSKTSEIDMAGKSIIIKKGYKLNYKTVYPSTLERQKLALVCNILHESNVAALL